MKQLSLFSLFFIIPFLGITQTKTTFFKEYLKPVTLIGKDFRFQKIIIWKMEDNEMSFIRFKETDFLDGQKYSRLGFLDGMMDEKKLSLSRIDLQVTDIQKIISKKNTFSINGNLEDFKAVKKQLKKYVVLVK